MLNTLLFEEGAHAASGEPVFVEDFVAQAAVEAFDVGVLVRFARLVLEDLSGPAERKAKAVKADAEADVDMEEEEDEDEDEDEDDAPEKMQEISVAVAERYSFGVTLDQIDSLDLLIQTLSAHGDVVAGSHEAEFADHTLPLIGQAIYDGVEAVRAILDEVEDQPLGPSRRPLDRVGETRAVYGAGFVGAAVRPGLQSDFGSGLSRTLQ